MMNRYDASRIIGFGLTFLPPRMLSNEAMLMLLAIGWQESGFAHRRQVRGPARGFWQFERAGIAAVLTHHATGQIATETAIRLQYAPTVDECYNAVEHNDVLAVVFARLLLWSDPHPLPNPVTQPDRAWDYYVRNWRPGMPHRNRWGKAIEYANGN